MKTLYRLKKDARKFFDEKLHDDVKELAGWKRDQIPVQLLDEVENVYFTYGHSRKCDSGLEYISACGWGGSEQEAHFHFTININDITLAEYEKFPVVKLMDELQKVTNEFVNRHLK